MKTKEAPSVDALEDSLMTMVTLCRLLVGVLRDEQDLLLHKKNGDWDLILVCKEKVLRNLSQAEQDWKRNFRETGFAQEAEEGCWSLTGLLERVEPSKAETLRNIQAELLSHLHDICVLNRENSTLLRHALYYNQSFLSLMHSFVDRTKSLIYGPQGKPLPLAVELMGRNV